MTANDNPSYIDLQKARYILFKEIAQVILEEANQSPNPIDATIQILSDYLAPVIATSNISQQQMRNKLFKEIAGIILEEGSQSPDPLESAIQILIDYLAPVITSYDDIKQCYQSCENALKLIIEYLQRQPPKDYKVELNSLYEPVEG